MNADFDLSQVEEGLVVRSGDHLILSFPNMAAEYAEELRKEAKRRLPKDIEVILVFGAEIAVIREQEIRDAIQRYEDEVGMWP